MTIDFMEYLKETLDDTDKLDENKIQSLAKETSAYLKSLGQIIQGDDEKAQEEAMSTALDIKEFLEEKVQTVITKAGITYEDLIEYSSNEGLSNEDQETIENIASTFELSKNNNKNKQKH